MPTLRDVVAVLDGLYDPRWAESWDAVGTAVGDPDAEVRRVLLAVDPVQAVADEAVAGGYDLVLTHHPLWLSGVTSVAASDPKGRVAHTLISHGIALHTCHTNADVPPLGVSAAMAEALGLHDVRPLETAPGAALDLWTVFVPREHAEPVLAAMHGAGAGHHDGYDLAAFSWPGTGQFRPLDGARPAVGTVGEVEHVDEVALRLVAPPSVRETVRAATLAAHPYEVPALDVVGAEPAPSDRGTGRIGTLAEPLTLARFAEVVRDALPAHGGATRLAGDPDRLVRTVALCGGSGDFLLGTATAAGADVYVTSDLKHHAVSEHLERPGACAVVDVPHWAAEWTWLPVAAAALVERLGATVEAHVSTIVTDPWTATLVHPDLSHRSPR
ncbi:Nif3-like dinuclear metal center hexameric protein [Aeromicrobium sp. Leaf350]|uniref:Nif3-like dinuclear metal center hexameric protein n=1 Tax=Aeromicrobium sp. Leaf350 TaxID=2876565 RepID=UPI001E38DEB6|nr:Nif3-like dinuclear metal center hexameric protein [Aeromicrobium sp. Leaf350]